MRRSTVLSLPLYLVFPDLCIKGCGLWHYGEDRSKLVHFEEQKNILNF